MITKGTIVRRISNDYLTHLNEAVLRENYPPPSAVCVVVSSPRERDLAYQLRATYSGHVSLKKAVDVLYGTNLYKDCELRAFAEVKKDDRPDL